MRAIRVFGWLMTLFTGVATMAVFQLNELALGWIMMLVFVMAATVLITMEAHHHFGVSR